MDILCVERTVNKLWWTQHIVAQLFMSLYIRCHYLFTEKACFADSPYNKSRNVSKYLNKIGMKSLDNEQTLVTVYNSKFLVIRIKCTSVKWEK